MQVVYAVTEALSQIESDLGSLGGKAAQMAAVLAAHRQSLVSEPPSQLLLKQTTSSLAALADGEPCSKCVP